MTADLDSLASAALTELASVSDITGLESWRIAYLGAKGKIRAAMASVKAVAIADRPAFGARINALRDQLDAAFEARRAEFGGAAATVAAGPAPDVTEPGRVWSETIGRRHVITRVREELCEVFARMGFETAEGPELEDDEHNFVKLNIPPHHPAREPSDNFYVDDPLRSARPRMLRSQTSTVQIRVMETRKPPIRIVAPGRVYRPDTVDATHSFMFHQIEGLCIDRGVSMADLKSTLFHFARAYFGADAEVRLRPSFFPFTEPSAEFDMKIRLRPDQPERWMELGGCGMVHPSVLEGCGIDPEAWTGFAFGFGIERLAMGKYSIPDIRMLFENDVRFLSQL
ncbi:MAG: phenylalanine--tRNA ligase subunit alpha [Phycisphaerae bacterium]|nr:phenylalanine--tRNA ligase subunit alpha [Phycisphaerae bacterium]